MDYHYYNDINGALNFIWGEIIRQGDTTSHKGTVLEGSMQDICHGKPIAYIGHKVYCPKCKGNFAIIQGAMNATFYGKGVALAGMKTSCGATLIPSQFTDTVEYGKGGDADGTTGVGAMPVSESLLQDADRKLIEDDGSARSGNNGKDVDSIPEKFDLYFHAVDAQQASLANVRYRIVLEDGRAFVGTTDKSGFTEKVYSDYAQKATIEIPYYDHCDTHSAIESSSCSC